MRRNLLVTAVVLVTGAGAWPALAAGPPSGPVSAPAGPGCDPTRPAVAHHSGGAVVHSPPRKAAVPCGVTTGFAGAESHVAVTNSGDVVYVPAVVPSGLLGTGEVPVDVDADSQNNASPAGMALTADEGAHWSLVKPLGRTWNPTDHALYVDPATGRLFFEDYTADPTDATLGPQQTGFPNMMWTDAPGRGDPREAWHRTVISTALLPENPRFTSAAAPTGGSQPVGYPDVVYFCANTNVGFTSPVILGRLCYKSLDGGSSWEPTTVLLTGPAPQHPECGGNGEDYSAIDGYYPEPAHDGTLYVMVACGGKTYLAHSTDEAASFPIVRRSSGQPLTLPVPPGSNPQLRVDGRDDLYLVYQQGRGLAMTVSRDLGLTWAPAVDLTAPGVTSVFQWALAQHGVGEVAVSYLGHVAGQPTYDAYLTVTLDALDAGGPGPGPLFWSGVLNPPTQPVLFGSGIQGAGVVEGPLGFEAQYPFPLGGAGNDFIGATIGPDGTPWASFDRDCGPTPSSPGCRANKAHTIGFAGRLVLPS